MSRFILMTLAAFTMMFAVSSVMAVEGAEKKKDEKPAGPRPTYAVVKSADLTAKTFVVTVGTGDQAKDVTYKFNDKTEFILDKQASTADKVLVAGNKVALKAENDLATRVETRTAQPKKEGEKKDKKEKTH